jgi:hypothetical protein
MSQKNLSEQKYKKINKRRIEVRLSKNNGDIFPVLLKRNCEKKY